MTDAVDVIRCVEWAIRTTLHELHHRARVSTDLSSVPPVSVDETKLGQVIVNLLINAAHAISPGNAAGNEVSITTRTDKSGRATIEVRDTGTGIRQDILDRIFEPFFTTKAHGDGAGLGLSICQGIVCAAGGQIQVESDVGRGTTVRVMLPPAVARTVGNLASSLVSATYPRGRILVVDDQPMVLSAIKRTLREHDLVCLTSAPEALTLIERGESFDLILSDLMMPSMTGIEFYERLLSVKPELARRVVFLTGGATTPEAIDFFQSVPNIRIDKPFGASKLQATVRQLLAARPSERAH
jgi:CheY-like chemotaxis protein